MRLVGITLLVGTLFLGGCVFETVSPPPETSVPAEKPPIGMDIIAVSGVYGTGDGTSCIWVAGHKPDQSDDRLFHCCGEPGRQPTCLEPAWFGGDPLLDEWPLGRPSIRPEVYERLQTQSGSRDTRASASGNATASRPYVPPKDTTGLPRACVSLVSWREGMGLTEEAAATRLGIDTARYTMIENGHATPTTDESKILQDAAGIPSGWW